MRGLKMIVLAATAFVALATAAEAGGKNGGHKGGFYFGGYGYQYASGCHYDTYKVPKVYHQSVKRWRDGHPYWVKVKRIRYVAQPRWVCDWHGY